MSEIIVVFLEDELEPILITNNEIEATIIATDDSGLNAIIKE